MDGGLRQEEMAERLKREVKEQAHRRRGERVVHNTPDRVLAAETVTEEPPMLPRKLSRDLAIPMCDFTRPILDIHNDGTEPCPNASTTFAQHAPDCTLKSGGAREIVTFGRSDTILITFYLENLFPFLFPFYNPSLLEGSRAWILEMMISSPVVRQATLCQSSYYLSRARGTTNDDGAWDTLLTQTTDAFGVLGQSLQVIDGSNIAEHLHGAVRIMTSIIQLQRFEVAVLSFNNCEAHLNAAVALFRQLLDSSVDPKSTELNSSFCAVMNRLGPSSCVLSGRSVQVPSAEQAAFRFSSALLIFDDIVASTVLQDHPKLYEYHHSLLGGFDDDPPTINLEDAVGCQNWVLLQIGEIAVIDAWKQQCKKAGRLNVMELVRRATFIKDSLESRLSRLEADPAPTKETSSLLDVFTAHHGQQSRTPASQSSLVTRVWAHAAMIYLSIVVSGWHPASVDVRYHVSQIVELLTHRISPPALLRTTVWPFCVAGCLAEPLQEVHFRVMAEALQPLSVFGTVHKALEIMENVWRSGRPEATTDRDFATCFRIQGDLVFLV